MNSQPKGGMCSACEHLGKDCSWRDFDAMPVLENRDGVRVVKCTGFSQSAHPEPGKEGV